MSSGSLVRSSRQWSRRGRKRLSTATQSCPAAAAFSSRSREMTFMVCSFCFVIGRKCFRSSQRSLVRHQCDPHVNCSEIDESSRQRVVADFKKPMREKRPRIENKPLHEQPREPENRDEHSQRTRCRIARSHLLCVQQRQRAEANDRE